MCLHRMWKDWKKISFLTTVTKIFVTSCLMIMLLLQIAHRVHIFTRDETGLVYLPIQLERTLHFTGDGKCNERGGHAPPPSPAWANFTLMMECMPESSRCYSVYSVDGVMPNWTNWRTMYAMSTKFRFLRSSLCFWIKNMSKRFSCSGSHREKCAVHCFASE